MEKRQKIVSGILLVICAASLILHYSLTNFAYVRIWYRRLAGDDILRINELKIPIPEDCILYNDGKADSSFVRFLCAISPTESATVNAFRVSHENPIEHIKKNPNVHIQTLEEHDDYFFVVVDIKGFDEPLALYYLKRQNVNIISSENVDLAKKFADLLVKYDFRVETELPDKNNKID